MSSERPPRIPLGQAELCRLGAIAVLVGVVTVSVASAPSGLVASTCGVGMSMVLSRGAGIRLLLRLGPGDWVTLVRAVLTGGVAALAARSLLAPTSHSALVVLTCVALMLDGVDGWVARRTNTASDSGARFDMEVDAFLLVALSVYVGHSTGLWWVLAIGSARYSFAVIQLLIPPLRGSSSPSYWRKAVAATQGVVLTVVASGLLGRGLAAAALGIALALLVLSFGQQAAELLRATREACSTVDPRLPQPAAAFSDA
jgi:phosphatidylglycerophosphate synthase